MAHIGNEQAEENVQLLDLRCKFRELDTGAVQHFVDRPIHLADLHDIDTVRAGRGDLDELTAHIGAGPVELMPLQRSDDKNGDVFAPHPERHQLHGEGFACTAGAQDRHVGVLIDRGIENIHDNQGAVIFVDSQKNAIVIAHLKRSEGITAGRAARQQVAFAALIKPFLHGNQREGRKKRLLFTEVAGADIHILRQQEFFHFADFPLQILHRGGCHGNQQIQVIKIFVVGKTLLQEISAPDSAVDVIKIGVCVTGVFDFRAVDTELLAHPLDDALFGLAGKEHIHVDAVTGVDDQAQPASGHLRFVPVRRNQQIGIVQSIHADIASMGKINASGGGKLRRRDMIDLTFPAMLHILRHHLLRPHRQRLDGALVSAQQIVEDINGKLILIFRDDDLIPTLAQVVGGRMDGALEGLDRFIFLL